VGEIGGGGPFPRFPVHPATSAEIPIVLIVGIIHTCNEKIPLFSGKIADFIVIINFFFVRDKNHYFSMFQKL
jgi:hypothetical protein